MKNKTTDNNSTKNELRSILEDIFSSLELASSRPTHALNELQQLAKSAIEAGNIAKNEILDQIKPQR